MPSIEYKILIVQWLSGVMTVLAALLIWIYTNEQVNMNAGTPAHQEEISGSYG